MSLSRTRWFGGALLLAAAYCFAAATAGTKVFLHERACSRLIDRIAADQDLDHVTNMDVYLHPGIMGLLPSFLLRLTSKAGTDRAAAANQRAILEEIAQLRREIAASTASAVALVAVTVLFLVGSRWRRRPSDIDQKIYDLLTVSLVFFLLGISSPVLTVAVKGQHILIGGFVIETVSKGILSTVVSLFRSGNWIISILLAGFSIGIPIFKGFGILATVLQPSTAKRERVGRALEAIGKWSLTDVVVAAVLLAIFSLNAAKGSNGGVTAVPRYALGFFIAYCILAAFTSSLLRRSARHTRSERVAPARIALAGATIALALAGGIATGRRLSLPLPPGFAPSGDGSIIPLVRAHEELIEGRYRADPGPPAVIAFTVPFRATLNVDLEVRGGATLRISVLPAASGPAPRGLPVEETASYKHSAEVPPGNYRVVAREDRPQSALFPSHSFSLHLSIDP